MPTIKLEKLPFDTFLRFIVITSVTLLASHYSALAEDQTTDPKYCGITHRCTIEQLEEEGATKYNDLRAKLNSDVLKTRVFAALHMCAFAKAVRETIPDLKVKLQDSEKLVRTAAAMAIRCGLNAPDKKEVQLQFSSLLKKAQYVLMSAYQDNDIQVRSFAYQYAGNLPEEDLKHATAVLYQRLKDSNSEVRLAALFGLTNVGAYRQFDLLQIDLKSAKYSPKLSSLDKKRRDVLLPFLSDHDSEVRSRVLELLVELARFDPVTRKQIFQLLRDKDLEVQRIAEDRLAHLGPALWDMVPSLIQSLQHPRFDVRLSACRLLGELGPDAIAALPTLNELMHQPEQELAHCAELSVGYINRDPDFVLKTMSKNRSKVLPQLPPYMEDPMVKIGAGRFDSIKILLETAAARKENAFKLCDFCPISPVARPLIERASKSEMTWTQKCAQQALAKFEKSTQKDDVKSKSAGKEDELQLNSSEPLIRRKSLLKFIQSNENVDERLKALNSGLKDDFIPVRMVATWAAGARGFSQPEVVSALRLLLNDKAPAVKLQAAWSLVQLEKSDPEVLNVIFATLKSNYYCVGREEATFTLAHPSLARPEIVSKLISLLGDECECVRPVAARVLASFGGIGESAMSALISNLGDNSECSDNFDRMVQDLAASAGPSTIDLFFKNPGGCSNSVRNGWVSAWSLGIIGRSSPSVVKAVLPILNDPDEDRRARAAFALSVARSNDLGVQVNLRKLVNDPSPIVRRATQDALRVLNGSISELDRYQLNCGSPDYWAKNWEDRWNENRFEGAVRTCISEPIVGHAEWGWGWFRAEKTYRE